MDEPDSLRHALDVILQKRLRYVEMLAGLPIDLIEVGGGAGSNTVISPKFFREFCLPYDATQNAALHAAGMKIVYHLCGGLMKMLELVVETGTDGLETMTPPDMGGDCDLAEAKRRVGGRLFLKGNVDPVGTVLRGTPDAVREDAAWRLAVGAPGGGYVLSTACSVPPGAPPPNVMQLRAAADA